MNLIIDIGNSRTKIVVFKGDQIIHSQSNGVVTSKTIEKIFRKYPVVNSIVSTVVKGDHGIKGFLKRNSRSFELTAALPLPIANLYKTKKTLGNDRLANAAGAAKLFPGKNVLVIDAGTCLKYDFIDAEKRYLGGAISPGLLMRYSSLHHYTQRLPEVKPVDKVKLTGATTDESIRSGVQVGIFHEMTGYVNSYRKLYGRLKVVITGGDSGRFAHLFNLRIFAAPNLTAIGLNEILQYQLASK